MSCFQLLNQELDVGCDEFLFIEWLFAVNGADVGGVGVSAHMGISLSAFAFALSASKRGMYMPNATWRRRG
jgi:hypothetical protein